MRSSPEKVLAKGGSTIIKLKSGKELQRGVGRALKRLKRVNL
jgi:hypothetical protein